ncbi:hypothetical protein EG329_011055, partial [Mollisiaceae sp. DMI_Dod_QoI]
MVRSHHDDDSSETTTSTPSMSNQPTNVAYKGTYIYDKNKWGKNLDIKDEENHNKETMNGMLLKTREYYEQQEYNDYILWDYFKEDFA